MFTNYMFYVQTQNYMEITLLDKEIKGVFVVELDIFIL